MHETLGAREVRQRTVLFQIGKWSYTNRAVAHELRSKFPYLDLVVVDLLAVARRTWRLYWALLKELPHLVAIAVRGERMRAHQLLYLPAVAALVQRIAQETVRELNPLFTVQTTTRFNAHSGLVPHFCMIDDTSDCQDTRRYLFAPLKLLERRLQEEVYVHSAAIFCLGAHVKRALTENYCVPPHRIFVTRAGPNVEATGRSSVVDTKRILFVGGDWPRKGGKFLLDAFRKIKPRHPDAVLAIAGCRPQLDGESGVEIIGKVPPEHLSALFSSARVFVLPTLYEPFGIVFVEALHFGLPIVATSVGAIPDMVRPGVNGFLVKPRSVDDLADAIDRILADDALASAFGAASREASVAFTWGRVGEVMARAIGSCVAASAAVIPGARGAGDLSSDRRHGSLL